MARRDDDDEPLDTDERIRRSVGRTLVTWTVALASLAVIAGWGLTGLYQLEPGEAAVVLRLGAFDRTVTEPGLKWHLPPPFETVEVVNYTRIRREKFGLVQGRAPEPGAETATRESAIQTADSNIVNLSYEVQYRIQDAFSYVYGMAEPEETLRDAAQAAVREVVGKTSVDDVLAEGRGVVQRQAERILQSIFDSYFASWTSHRGPFEIESVNLLVVQPPQAVQDAFDDVQSAQQDQDRAASQARGDATEILERAKAEAIELREAAEGYKRAQIIEARGKAQRFVALLQEYRFAPEVTRRRLYLETMEEVMPGVDKVIVEPETVQLMPFFPTARPPAAPAPPPVSGDASGGRRDEESAGAQERSP